ncbi:MAG TPA: AsnC family transcriptional regulator [Sedimentisphaerales bacterium]|nr:AsnC family transcriptional regulator [Sedimentisphaerales bacterium]
MDELDHRILDALQNEFPLSERPYDVLAERLEIPGDELWERVRRLVQEGVIRRMGTSLDSRKLGYSSTLAAISVPAERVDEAAQVVGKYPEVTHSYLRNDQFNIWFTVIAADSRRIANILEEIRSALSLERAAVLNLPMTKLFKLDARFKTPG